MKDAEIFRSMGDGMKGTQEVFMRQLFQLLARFHIWGSGRK
jgi:hypothetical protein